jgi:hypothetical protein
MNICQRTRQERTLSEKRITSMSSDTTPIEFRSMWKDILLNCMYDVCLFLSTLVGEYEAVKRRLAGGKMSEPLEVDVDCQRGLALEVEVLVE